MNIFKGLGDLGALMGQMQQVSGQMQTLQDELRRQRVQGNAGGGMVTVEMNGAGEMLNIQLDPQLVTNNEREMLEDLIPAAVNAAIEKAKQLHSQKLQSLTNGIAIPGLSDAISRLTGAERPDRES